MATVATRVTQRARTFYVGMALGLLAIVAAGFGPGYYNRLSTGQSLPSFVHLHAALFTGWMVLLIAQATLVAADRVAWHRRLGLSGALLVPVLLVLGYWTAIYGAQHGHPFANGPGSVPFRDAYAFLIVPLGDLVLFGGFAAAAIHLRRRADWHKRLIMLAAIGGFMWPAITRIPHVAGNPIAMFGLFAVTLIAVLVYDFVTRGRVHVVNVIGATVILLSLPLRRAIGGTQAWHDLAVWLTS